MSIKETEFQIQQTQWLIINGSFKSVLKKRNSFIVKLEKAELEKDLRAIRVYKEEISALDKSMDGFVSLHLRAGWDLTDEMQNFSPHFKSIEKEDRNDSIWAIADDLRHRKDEGEFETYKEAYMYGEKHYTVNGQPITVAQLENNFYKARSSGRL